MDRPISPDTETDPLPAQESHGSSPAQAADARLAAPSLPSRYESQKRRDWQTFLQYLRNLRPPLALGTCGSAHVIEFLRYLDQFGKTKVHVAGCGFFGSPDPCARCSCPLRQAWGSLDSLIGRLRAAFEESGGQSEANPFAAPAVRVYLREVRESQAKARGITYEKKKRKRMASEAEAPASSSSSLSSAPAMSIGATERSAGDVPPGGSC